MCSTRTKFVFDNDIFADFNRSLGLFCFKMHQNYLITAVWHNISEFFITITTGNLLFLIRIEGFRAGTKYAVRVNWGKPCFKKEYQDRFYNRRACAMVRFRDAIRSGRVVLPQNIDRKLREKILLQGARLPYHFAEAGGLKYVMEKRKRCASKG